MCECVRDGRVVVFRVTWGSEVRSHEELSSSIDDSDAKDVAVFDGGKMRNLIWLCRQRGIGIES